jgi:glyceraldehyde-3-phosphate dehydrogenase type I
MRIALNGFGRIGKNFLRIWLERKHDQQKLELVAINVGPADPAMIAYMTKYDTIMGTYNGSVEYRDGMLIIDNKKIKVLNEIDATKLPWRTLNIDWLVDVSGKFTEREKAEHHRQAGAKKVLISAPAQQEDVAIIPGVNGTNYNNQKHHIVSLASCTTNALMTALYVIHQAFGIEQAMVSTTHAYTNSQALLDVNAQGKDPRKSRAAAMNIIPTTTGASKMVGKIIPELDGKIFAHAQRVPIDTVSFLEIVFTAGKEIDAETINKSFERASQKALKNILAISYEPLVSSDYQGNSHSVIIDGLLTLAQNRLGKVCGWYDNEWGYTSRLLDFLASLKE